jgi:HK97 gp10 family phage protein
MTVTWNGASVLAKVRAATLTGIVRGTESIREEATDLILKSAKSGEVYTWVGTTKDDPRRDFLVRAPQGHKFWARLRSTPHQASAPGEPPASDTGHLLMSIDTSVDPQKLTGNVNFGSKYANWLEYGTRYMEPRPFARPAAQNKKEAIRADIAEEISGALK